MIDIEEFVGKLENGIITHVFCVPCSYAKDFITYVCDKSTIEYVPCPNEGSAVSAAIGMKLSGEGKPMVIMQSSGLANAASTLTTLSNPYNVNVPILISHRPYEIGASEIQHKVLATKLEDVIHSFGFTPRPLLKTAEKAIEQIRSDCPSIYLFDKSTFAPHKSSKAPTDSRYMRRGQYLKYFEDNCDDFKDASFICTTGKTCREAHAIMPSLKKFLMTGNMGHALAIGVGKALASSDDVYVLGGDGESMMHAGNIFFAEQQVENFKGTLTYIIFNNGGNQTTGGQPSCFPINRMLSIHEYCPIYDMLDFKYCLIENTKKKFKVLHVNCSNDEVSPRPTMDEIIQSKEALR